MRLPVLDERQLDLIGLGLLAVGAFLACVMYFDLAGGSAGDGLADGLRVIVGTLGYAIPAALVIAGLLVIVRPFIPSTRPLRLGAGLLLVSVDLMLAAGTLGIGPGGARAGEWSASFVERRGGIVGEAIYSGVTAGVSSTGAHILALFLFVAAVLLLTGTSIATALAVTGARMRGTATLLRQSGSEVTQIIARRRPAPALPPEPEDGQLVLRATHAEAHRRHADELEAIEEPAPAPAEPDEAEALADDGAGTGVTPVDGVAAVDPGDLTPQGRYRESVLADPAFDWRLPDPAKVLRRSKGKNRGPDAAAQQLVAERLLEALGHHGVAATLVGTVTGPHITRYELQLAPGTKVARVAQLDDDLRYALAAAELRILAPIPGKQAVGVEVPNASRRTVLLGDVWQDAPADYSPLAVWLGENVAGTAICVDLARMPHLLVAGTTGAGKSAAVNAMLASILLRATPQQVRLVLVDPKRVELTHYESIPHLLVPVVDNPRKAANALHNLVREMDERYGTMKLAKARSLPELNRHLESKGKPPLPYILCVIDELADLMMVAPADVEDSVIRLAQKARAVGIHLLLATQSPRVTVITGMIKANVPSRIAFAVSSQQDSRVILDQNGAETLLGQGDMLFSPPGSATLQRIQGAYIDEAQILGLTDHWRDQGEPEFREDLLEDVEAEQPPAGSEDDLDPDEDPLLEKAIHIVVETESASVSGLQRVLRVGYTRAGRLIDMLERRGIVSGYEGSKPRQVLISRADLPQVLAGLRSGGEQLELPPEPDAAETVVAAGDADTPAPAPANVPD
jgi:S-DNA-T family DNA segregation ATPase FtsK/SpoIIIE